MVSTKRLNAKVSLAYILSSSVMIHVGMISPFWKSSEDRMFYRGLWWWCGMNAQTKSRECSGSMANWEPNWFELVQAFEVMASLCLLVACGILIHYVTKGMTRPGLKKMQAVFVLTICAGTMGSIGAAVYTARQKDMFNGVEFFFDWAYGLVLSGYLGLTVVPYLVYQEIQIIRRTYLDF